MAIRSYDREVGAIEPPVQLAKAVGTTLDLDGAIDAEQRHGEIGAGVAGARALLGGEAIGLQQMPTYGATLSKCTKPRSPPSW
jgi:hypothetical protein